MREMVVSDYVGARFYKCDLHVHTPEDTRNWDARDAAHLRDPRTEHQVRSAAKTYLRACHSAELEVIGVTDHNFSDRSDERLRFLTHLVEQNKPVAGELGREPLYIFPGFEIDLGFHVVCLFNPGTHLRDVSQCLTSLGPMEGKRFEKGAPVPCRRPSGKGPTSLDEALRTVQDQCGGLIVGAHAFSSDGIAEHARFAEEYRDERLLAVEVNSADLSRREKGVLDGANPPWRRRRPAHLLSSDCKRLAMVDGNGSNYLGCRFSWVKMSEPSIEALRQAFLDHESRIRFGCERPEEGYTYPKIVDVTVEGASFLADQEHRFSPNLTALIGGRGSGKSTLIEYLRLTLGQEDAITGEEPAKNFTRLKRTLSGGSKVRVSVEKEGQIHRLLLNGVDSKPVVDGLDVRPELFFPVQIYSQKEIYAISDSRESRAHLLDTFVRSELAELDRRVEDVMVKVRDLDGQIATEPQLRERLRVLEAERLDLDAKVRRLQASEKPLAEWDRLEDEVETLNGIRQEAAEFCVAVRDAVTDKSLSVTELDEDVSNGPHADLLRATVAKFQALKRGLKAQIESLGDGFQLAVENLLSSKPLRDLATAFEAASQAQEAVIAELTAKGIEADKYKDYAGLLKKRRNEIRDVTKRVAQFDKLRREREKQLRALRSLWLQQTKIREKTAAELTALVPKTFAKTPFVALEVDRFGDDKAFADLVDQLGLLRDKRRVKTDDWGAFDENQGRLLPADSMLACAVATRQPGQSPSEVLLNWIDALARGQHPPGCPWSPSERRADALLEWVTKHTKAELGLIRVPDRVRVYLNRQDGSCAGELEEGLSIGQRCTAIVTILLARGQTPVVIDQPEEDVDNEVVYSELVPLLRKIKEQRQVMVATHNANIPVNGDAELIIGLEARGQRGSVKLVDGARAEGALDRRAVSLAVQSVMEGSADAFRRRREKYGF